MRRAGLKAIIHIHIFDPAYFTFMLILLLAAGAGFLVTQGLAPAVISSLVIGLVLWNYPQVLPALLLVGTAFLHAFTYVWGTFATRGDVLASPTGFLPALVAVLGPIALRVLSRVERREPLYVVASARKWLVVWMSIFFAWLAFRWLGTPTPIYGATKVIGFAAFSLFPSLLFLSLIRTSKDMERILEAVLYVGGSWVLTFLSIAVIKGDLNLYHSDPGELFGSTNLAGGGLGGQAAMVMLVGLGTWVCGRRRRYLGLSFAAAAAVAVVLAGHRGTVAGITGGLAALWLAMARRRRYRPVAAITAVLVMSISAFLAWRSAPTFIRGRYIEAFWSESLEQRLSDQAVSLRAWVESPLIGHGTGSSAYIIARVDQPQFGVVQGIYPHNVVVELLAETGSIGLAIYLLAVGGVLALGLRRMPETPWYAPVLFALAVHAFVTSQAGADLTIHNDLWILLSLLAGAVSLPNDRRRAFP